jgi:cephalosporin-C deacetylase
MSYLEQHCLKNQQLGQTNDFASDLLFFMSAFPHSFPFDPTYGYGLSELLQIEPPKAPADFESFWQLNYQTAFAVDPRPTLRRSALQNEEYLVYDIEYRSTGVFTIGGWLLLPRNGIVKRALIVSHGYGGRTGPDFALPVSDAAVLFPCFRGLSRSARAPISTNPQWHVLHDLHQRDRYIMRGCVEDLWLGVSALLTLYPWIQGRIGYMGTSLGGGIGALALPWETRIARGHFCVPTFGHQELRLSFESNGSLSAIRGFHKQHPEVVETLLYFDAAVAASFLRQPIHMATAAFDPMVPPPGQFAIYNALPGKKQLLVLAAGHFEYADKPKQERILEHQLKEFFTSL